MTIKCNSRDKVYLITGASGFIGFYLSKKLLEDGCHVIGIDNMNDYYDASLKHARHETLKPYDNITRIEEDISNKEQLMVIYKKYTPDIVMTLAAHAAVRYSIENPDAYIQGNMIGS